MASLEARQAACCPYHFQTYFPHTHPHHRRRRLPFDCVHPTRVARNGAAFTPDGLINLRNERYRTDPAPLVAGLGNYTEKFSRAYLRHLVMAGEILASTLITIHNLHFYLDPMAQARAHIEAGDFAVWSRAWIARYEAGEAAAVR